MSNHTNYCDSCGQKIRKWNPHRMDRNKVALLEKIAKLNNEGHTWVKVQRDHKLIRKEERGFTIQCDDVHALRLTWFGLLERQAIRTGLYRATRTGLLFLQGQATVPSIIYCRDGQVGRTSEKPIYIDAVEHVVFDKPYWNSYWEKQTYLDDSDDKGQRTLFPAVR